MSNKPLVIGSLVAAVGFTAHALYLMSIGGGSIVWMPAGLAMVLYGAAVFVAKAVPNLKRKKGSWVQPADKPDMARWQRHRDASSASKLPR
jgi:hypothetical protein